MNRFLPDNFSRIGRVGRIIDIGKTKNAGEYRAINLGPKSKGRN